MGAFCDGLEFSSTLSSKYCSLILLSLQRGDFVLSNYGEEEKLSSESFFHIDQISRETTHYCLLLVSFFMLNWLLVGGQG